MHTNISTLQPGNNRGVLSGNARVVTRKEMDYNQYIQAKKDKDSSVSKLIVNTGLLTEPKKQELKLLIDYLNIGLRTLTPNSKFQIYENDVKNYLQYIFNSEQQEFINNAYFVILVLCTHKYALFDSATSYTKSAADFIKEYLIVTQPDTQNLEIIKQFLNNNFLLPIEFSVKNEQPQLINKLMQVVIQCGKSNTNYWNFKGLRLEGIKFENLNLSKFDFSDAQFNKCSFTNTKLNNTNWNKAQLDDITFTNSELDNADFTTATINQLNIDDVASMINTEFNVNSIVNWRKSFSTSNFKPQHQHLVIQILTHCKNYLEGLQLTKFSLPLIKPPTVKIMDNQHNIDIETININNRSGGINLVQQVDFKPLNYLSSEQLPAVLIIKDGPQRKYIGVSRDGIDTTLTLAHFYDNESNRLGNYYLQVARYIEQKGVMQVFRNIPVEMLPSWLQNVNFNGVKLDQLSFKSLMRINIAGAVVHNVNLENLDLRDANLVGLQLSKDTSFKNSLINFSQLQYLHNIDANLEEVVLSTIDFTGLDLRNIDLSKMKLFSYTTGLLVGRILTDAVKFNRTKLNIKTYNYILGYVSAALNSSKTMKEDLGKTLKENFVSFDLSDLSPYELQLLINGERDKSCLRCVPIIISQDQLKWLSEHNQSEIKYIIIENANLSSIDLQHITLTDCVFDNVTIEGTPSKSKIVNINNSRFIGRVILNFVDLNGRSGNDHDNYKYFINLSEADITNSTITTGHLNFYGSVTVNNSFLKYSYLSILPKHNRHSNSVGFSVSLKNTQIEKFDLELLYKLLINKCKLNISNCKINNWEFTYNIPEDLLDNYFNHLHNSEQESILTYVNSMDNLYFKITFMEKLVDWINTSSSLAYFSLIGVSLADILLLPTYYESKIIQTFMTGKLKLMYTAGDNQILPISERLIYYLNDIEFGIRDGENSTIELSKQHEFMINYNGFFLQCIYFCRCSSDKAINEIGVMLYDKYLKIEYIDRVSTQSGDDDTDTSLKNIIGYNEWRNDHLIFIRIAPLFASNHLLCITNEFMATHLCPSKLFGGTLIVNPPTWSHFLYYNDLRFIKPTTLSVNNLFEATDLFRASYKEFILGNTPQQFEVWVSALNLNEEYTQLFLNPTQLDLTGWEANQQFTWAFYGYRIVELSADSNAVSFTPNIIHYKILNETTADLIYYTDINSIAEKHQLKIMLKGDKLELINIVLNTTLTLDNILNITRLDGDLITNILESLDIETCRLIKLDSILFNENRIIFNPAISNPANKNIKDQVELTDTYVNKITKIYNLDLWQQDNEYVVKIWMHLALVLIRYSSSYVFGKSLNSPALIRLLIAAYLKFAHKTAPDIITEEDLTNWLDRLFAQNNQFDCTAMLFDRIYIYCKSKFGSEFTNLLPPFCRS